MKKKILLTLFVFAGIYLYAQDTLFVSKKNAVKGTTVTVIVPDSIYNYGASEIQNAQVWYYRKNIYISEKREVKYQGLHRITKLVGIILSFNPNTGKNEIIKQDRGSSISFAYELIFALTISFLTMMFFQKSRQRKIKFKTNNLTILLAITIGIILVSENGEMPLIHMSALALASTITSFAFSYHFSNLGKKESIVKFIVMNIVLSAIITLPINAFSLFFACNLGLFFGLPTYYFWKHIEVRKLEMKNSHSF
jgi:hypothetical protein